MLWVEVLRGDFLGYGGLFVGRCFAVGMRLEGVEEEGDSGLVHLDGVVDALSGYRCIE